MVHLFVYFFKNIMLHLNTSYVMVHPKQHEVVDRLNLHLNTSYVMVHQASRQGHFEEFD